MFLQINQKTKTNIRNHIIYYDDYIRDHSLNTMSIIYRIYDYENYFKKRFLFILKYKCFYLLLNILISLNTIDIKILNELVNS
jgi:hypothetical protein